MVESAKRKTLDTSPIGSIVVGAGAASMPPEPGVLKFAQLNGSPGSSYTIGAPVVSWVAVAVVVVNANKLGGEVY